MSNGYKDFYQILGVPRNASDKEIKNAYRRLARKHHPDVNPGDKSAEEKFKEVQQAYDVLSDPEKRQKYDQFGEQWERVAQGAPGAGGFTWGQAPDGFDFSFETDGGFGNLFELLFGDASVGGRARTRARRDVRYDIEVTLEEAFSGATKRFTADGKRLEVKIPPGVDEGSVIRLAGQGETGRDGQRGDMLLNVRLRPHAVFERRGADLYRELSIPYTIAALGGEVQVPTLAGRVTMRIPPGTQSGQSFRLAGQGMPKINSSGKGDLYVKTRITVPKTLSAKEKQLLQELASISGSRVGTA